jgi:MFS family permease
MMNAFNRNKARSPRTMILLLGANIGLMMTGYGIVMPVFAKRLAELGSGVDTLGFMTMAFAISQFLLSPFMGSLADRFGRRPLILTALAGMVLTNIGFLLARSTEAYIALRLFDGAITAGLLPASMGVVADTVAEEERAKWVGILMGSYGAGFILGPTLGGFLFDHWDFVAPFGVSAALGFIGLIAAFALVQETRVVKSMSKAESAAPTRLIDSLPRPLYVLATLLLLDFVIVFAFAFIEPQMMFYLYDRLGISTTEMGLIVGVYGLAMVFGQTVLAPLSDRFGRKPMIALGFALSSVFYVGLATVTQVGPLFVVAIVAGLGNALVTPALSASYLDITAEAYRSRVMGVKESMSSLGGVLGPLAVALVSRFTTPIGVFTIAAVMAVGAMTLTLLALKQPTRHAARVMAIPVPAGK